MQTMESYLYLAVALLLVSSINGRAIDDMDNSILGNNTNNEGKISVDRDWIEISVALPPPPKLIQQSGNAIELECEVTGSPQPTIHWIRGNNSHNIVDNFNVITETSPNALVRVRSRLIIEHTSASERTFTCVGRAGSKTAYESTTIYGAPGHKSHNLTELLSLNGGAKKARIVTYYSALFDTIGTNVVLPCRAAGRPNPEIYWLDPDDNVINGRDHRLRVHPSGALHISSLRWSDMGSYTCIAKNPLDKDSVSTFVYPVSNEDLEK